MAVGALEDLKSPERPELYCSAVTLVREDLTEINVHRRCTRGPSFENTLVENIATSCTIVLNRPAIGLLSRRRPEHLLMHDAWCYLVVAGCREVVYDRVPHVLYRLHQANSVRVGTTLWSAWSGRARRQLERVLTAQAKELGELHGGDLRPGRCLLARAVPGGAVIAGHKAPLRHQRGRPQAASRGRSCIPVALSGESSRTTSCQLATAQLLSCEALAALSAARLRTSISPPER